MIAWYEVGRWEKTVWKALRPSLCERGGWGESVSLAPGSDGILGDGSEGRDRCDVDGVESQRKEGKKNVPDDGLLLDIASPAADSGHPVRCFLSNS